MTAPDKESGTTVAVPTRREAAERVLEANGAAIYGYCIAMLGESGAAEVLPGLFGYIEEHLSEAIDQDEARLTLHAAAHNRCIQHSRMGGKAPRGEGLEGDALPVIAALAELKPVGREAMLLRFALGLQWDELERVCGVPRARLIMRVCRAWRRIALSSTGPKVVQEKVSSTSPKVVQEKVVQEGEEGAEKWSAIRAEAARFILLRSNLRRAYILSATPPEGWCAKTWAELDQRREDERLKVLQQAKASAQEADAAQAAEAARAATEPSPPLPPPPPHTNPTPTTPWRMIALATVLTALAFTIYWVATH